MALFPKKIDPKTGEGILEAYQDFVRLVRTQAYEGINNAAYVVYDKSQIEVPVYTGALRESGRVEGDKRDKAENSKIFYRVVAYGLGKKVNPTPNAPDGYVRYAVEVHEDMSSLQEQTQKVYKALKSVTRGSK